MASWRKQEKYKYLMFCINERYGLLYLLQGGLQLVRRDLLLVHPPVVSCVQPDIGNNPLSDTVIIYLSKAW